MKQASSKQHIDGKLPVFVFPNELKFYIDDQSSHKQVLTLYNPYEFTVQFKVLCNNPSKYNVVESEGLIKQKCCIDIVIRVTDFQQILRREDKFRVHIYEHGLSKLLGKTDVTSTLMQTQNESKREIQLSRSRKTSVREAEEVFYYQQRRESVIVQRSLPSLPVVMLSLVCVIALMLPTYGDEPINDVIPKYLHLTLNQKLIAAYVLGLVTMAILKT